MDDSITFDSNFLEQYANWQKVTAFYPDANMGTEREATYLCLGLAGESGEFIDIIKKMSRSQKFNSQLGDPETKKKLVLELGDVLWYISRLTSFLDVSIKEVMELNFEKLEARGQNEGWKEN